MVALLQAPYHSGYKNREMKSFQYHTPIGVLCISWSTAPNQSQTESPKLSQLEIIETKVDSKQPELPLLGLRTMGRDEIPQELQELAQRVTRYLSTGEPLGEIPWSVLDQSQWSEFQQSVYRAISQVPHGETRTYGWVAKKIRKISACRAVGQALKRNPFPILIPCHRIVGNETLGGFMGTDDPSHPEMHLKKGLLRIEEEFLNPRFDFLLSPRAVA